MSRPIRGLVLVATLTFVVWRLWVLASWRGGAVVLEATVRVTGLALAAWVFHLVFHELAHLAVAQRQGFLLRGVRLGPLEVDVSGPRPVLRFTRGLGGAVFSLPPVGPELFRRLRWVALAGPVATALLTAGLAGWWLAAGRPPLSSPIGVGAVVGLVTLVTALLPSWATPSPPASGTDLEQVLQPRFVRSHWLSAATLRGVLEGRSLAESLPMEKAKSLLPTAGPVERLELVVALAELQSGELSRARERLTELTTRFDDQTPSWLQAETFNQLAALGAFGGELERADRALEQLVLHQAEPWYHLLAQAAVSKARGGAWESDLRRWEEHVSRAPGRRLTLAGNEWILARLRA